MPFVLWHIRHTGKVVHSKGSRQCHAVLVFAGVGEEGGRVRGSQGARCFIADPTACSRVCRDGGVFGWAVATVQFTEDQVSIDFLWRVEARAVCGLGRVVGDLDPVITTGIALRLAIRISRQVSDDDVASAQ